MMKKTMFILGFLFLASMVSATQEITDLNTNSPVFLDQKLTVSGTFNDTDTNATVFCKFLVENSSGQVIDRWADELTYDNGDFYAEKIITEPIYRRGETFEMNVICIASSANVNFSVVQREAIDKIARQEFLFFFERGNLDTLLIMGSIILAIIAILSVIFIFIKRARNF